MKLNLKTLLPTKWGGTLRDDTKNRLFHALHRSPLSERLEQATLKTAV